MTNTKIDFSAFTVESFEELLHGVVVEAKFEKDNFSVSARKCDAWNTGEFQDLDITFEDSKLVVDCSSKDSLLTVAHSLSYEGNIEIADFESFVKVWKDIDNWSDC